MEYVFASLILHYAKKPITEENIRKILSAADIDVDEVRVKALVATLNEVNIDEVIKSAAVPAVSMPTTVQQQPPPEEKKEEEKKEEEKKEEKEEESMEGLAALFG